MDLVHLPTGERSRATERRSREENLRAALFRLRLSLATRVRMPAADREPSALWRSRLQGSRVVVSPSHGDLPALLAEALDHLETGDWDGAAAARRLGCTMSQLVRLLALHHPALETWNRARAARGLRPLRP